jgi:hypothetical protein
MALIIVLLILLLKILTARYCAGKATALNRNAVGWGIFGFFAPIIAYFFINAMSAKQGGYEDTSHQPFDRI